MYDQIAENFVENFYLGAFAARVSYISAGALLVYDYVLTWDDEFQYIWKRAWSFGKFLFIILGCYGTHVGTGVASLQGTLSWLPGIVYEIILCSLTIYKAFELFIESSRRPLLRVIFRDSLYYYFSVLAVLIINILMSRFAPPNLSSLFIAWVLGIPSTIGGRLILHVRKRVAKTKRLTTITITEDSYPVMRNTENAIPNNDPL
ncbi:hypothetical protein M422DRAFT_779898 [Sphaerobolus stellatus SS14]|uniref:DUF6533 domain-containing protein n=1 Tax=Sphaerobolus stellatus (strain SS14) TaxID=990650 RepID=A0A0C9UI82_SPHS4|nr:hypothetical protein M422DRAFT_779898 [Sphaerobolus stellatus SS14]